MIAESSSFDPLLRQWNYYIRNESLTITTTGMTLKMAQDKCYEEYKRIKTFKVKPSSLTNVKGI